MTCAKCTKPDAERVTLVDGRQVCTWCEDWRHECEARAILAIQPLARRRAHLYGIQEPHMKNGKPVMIRVATGIQQMRGDSELKRLENTMRALWAARKSPPAA